MKIQIALKFKNNPPATPHPDTVRKQTVVDRLSGKVNKSEANYRHCNEMTKACCAECDHYLLPGNPSSSCRRVAGLVEAEATCDLFAARPTEGQGHDGTAEENNS